MAPANRKQPARAASSDSLYSLMEFLREFPDDDACLVYLWRTRYSPDGEHAECPRCTAVRPFKRYATAQQRQSWTCTGCGHHIQPTAGTIFAKSSTSLHLWFYAMYLMTSTRCGISAKQLERELGVTYKTAWRIMKQIRSVLGDDSRGPLSGEVEMDETYFAPSKRVHDVRDRKRRTHMERVVWGAVERQGRIVVRHVKAADSLALMHEAQTHILPESTVFTDEHLAYKQLGRRGYVHHRIKHSAKVYVEGEVHTQTIEGFWSLLKRGLGGVYHAVGAKYLQSYLDEYAWRYNHREDGRAMFLTLIERAAFAA